MKRLQIHGLWLVLQIISTTQENATLRNMNYVTSTLILLPTPSILKSLDKQTVLVHKSPSIVLEERYTNTPILQSSEISKSGSLASALTPQRTRTQSVRNLCNSTQSKSVRDIFKNTQTQSVDLQTMSATGNMLTVRPNRTYYGSDTYKLNPSTVGLQNSTIKVTGSSEIVQYTTGDFHRSLSANISKTHSRKSSTVYRVNTSVLQGSITESENSNLPPHSKTIESTVELTVSSSRSYQTLESSSNYRFPLSSSAMQTSQPSRIITVSLSRPSISETEKFKTRVFATSSYANTNQSSYTSNTYQGSTLKDLRTYKTTSTVYITSTNRGSKASQTSRHGSNNSYLYNTLYLSSTTTVNKDSTIKPTKVMTRFASISQTSASKESINTQGQTSSQKTILEGSSSSEDILIILSASMVSDLGSSILEAKVSSYHSTIKSSSKVPNYKSQEISSERLIPPTTPNNNDSSGTTGMPLYVLAICLPLAAFLGFALACVYFKRNKEDQRVRYSVTVEVSAEKPEHEMKRMYSIIDVSGGINKDFLSGLESRKASSEILDQLDNVSVTIEQPDQNV